MIAHGSNPAGALSLHTLTANEANDGSPGNSRLPPPEQTLIVKMAEPETAEMIEKHVEFYTETGDSYRSVHLPTSFVRHYQNRPDRALPVVNGVSSLPIVLRNGDVLAGRGLDRKYGIVFRIPAALLDLLPRRKDCTADRVGKAMQFLCEEWLCDVATSYEGKAIVIACALTIVERLALPDRPAFYITAGQRGGGKTTTLHMISVAVLGLRAAAAAWSQSDEERRKALFAYLGAGLPFLVWDNIPRGVATSCPSIEKALTTEIYSDRVLGESEQRQVPAYTIQAFTGNNITPRSDLASRSLLARLTVDRPDPENRIFRHADAVAWTEAQRGQILANLYTVLLGNLRLATAQQKPADTRFKPWWHLVGAAVEYAAQQHRRIETDPANWLTVDPSPCPPKPFRFRDLFLEGEADDEQAGNLATVLSMLSNKFSAWTFQASDVATFAGRADEQSIAFKAALELATGKSLPIISAPAISARLRAVKDTPVTVADKMLTLRYTSDHEGGRFKVVEGTASP
jgi:hypothetical protein